MGGPFGYRGIDLCGVIAKWSKETLATAKVTSSAIAAKHVILLRVSTLNARAFAFPLN